MGVRVGRGVIVGVRVGGSVGVKVGLGVIVGAGVKVGAGEDVAVGVVELPQPTKPGIQINTHSKFWTRFMLYFPFFELSTGSGQQVGSGIPDKMETGTALEYLRQVWQTRSKGFGLVRQYLQPVQPFRYL